MKAKPRTNGTARLVDRKWVIEVEPHVAHRLKRTFAQIGKQHTGPVVLSDTVDVCRDLAWFCERFPLDVSPADYLAKRAAEHKAREELVARLLLGGHHDTRKITLALPPRDYQLQAAALAYASRGLLLADELGTGKTVSAICVMTDPEVRPALVVCPTHLQRQWRDELRKFAPQLTSHILKKGTPYDYSVAKRAKAGQLSLLTTHPDVLITSYHKLKGWADTLSGKVKGVFADEVHELRTGPLEGAGANKRGSEKYTAFRAIGDHAALRMGMSATPLYNMGGEIFHVLDALLPGSLGTKDEFHREHCGHVGQKPALEDPEAFGADLRARGLMLRRTRKDVGRELPPLTRIPHHVDCNPAALEAIRSSAGELARIILGQAGRQLDKGEKMQAAGELDARVRQATGIAKAPFVAHFVRMLLEQDEKVVLAGWHRAVYDIWLAELKEFRPVLYTGSESDAGKDAAKRAFCEGRTNLLIISLRSGSGLDGLQYSGCKTVVHGELDWSWAVHEQLEGRPHRDGQTDAVASYYLTTDQGSDPIVAEVLGLKRAQLEGVRDPDAEQRPQARTDKLGDHVKRLAEELLRRQESRPRNRHTEESAAAPA